MSLPAGGDQRLNKRLKSQLAAKPSEAGRMDMHGRCVRSDRLKLHALRSWHD
jgi:hypothetical protein